MGRNNQRKAKRVLLLVLAISVLMATFAQAELITIAIEAVVDTVEDSGNYLEGQVDVCDVITGYYTYESTTSDTNPSDYIGNYEHSISPYGIFLTVGGFNFQTDLTDVDFLLSVVNAGGPYTSDDYVIASDKNLDLSNGTPVEIISWALSDSTTNALSSDYLPTNAPILLDWQFNHLRLEGDRTFLIDAHVISATPEPTTILLLLAGTALLRKRG